MTTRTHRKDPVSTNTCRCGRTVHEGTTLCPACVRTLVHALVNVACHYADLDTLRTRRARYGGSLAARGSIGKTRPIGVDLRFVTPSNADYASPDDVQIPGREGAGTALIHDVRNTVVTWVRVCLDDWPTLTTPADHIPACCAFLQGIVTAIAGQAWATELLEDMLRLERALARMVDRPAERWYAGKCSASDPEDGDAECSYELYARTDSGTIRCQACGTEHDVAERRDFLLREAGDYHVTATEAAGALIAWTDYDGSEHKLVDLIRKWRDREKLDVQDVTSLLGRDRHLYRLGDIQELLVRHAQREQERRIRAGRSA